METTEHDLQKKFYKYNIKYKCLDTNKNDKKQRCLLLLQRLLKILFKFCVSVTLNAKGEKKPGKWIKNSKDKVM